MKIDKALVCPKCKGTAFQIKRVATYLYTYKLDTPLTDIQRSEEEALPFLFDFREQLDNREYLECQECHSKFQCELKGGDPKIHLTILQRAIPSDYVNNPGYLG